MASMQCTPLRAVPWQASLDLLEGRNVKAVVSRVQFSRETRDGADISGVFERSLCVDGQWRCRLGRLSW